MDIKNLKISILGAVRSGIGAAKLAKQFGANVFVSDISSEEKLISSINILQSEGIDFECGKHSDNIYDSDLIIISPGIPSDSEVIINSKAKGIKIISELEFASSFCKGTIIGITGTNGKTTTTSLVAHTLNNCGLKAYAAGNIGLAFSDIVSNLKEKEFVALEISSFQLDYIENFHPRFSTILNITPDHLDRYENNFENYKNSKLSIFKNQNFNDYFISNYDDKQSPNKILNKEVNHLKFSLKEELSNGAFLKDNKLFFSHNNQKEHVCNINDLSLKGEHNIANTLVVMCIAKLLKIENEKIKNSFSTFPGVEHRLEFVRELDGVTYINDSKATNVDSVWYALRSFSQSIILILGGKDKGNDYSQIKDEVINNVKKIYAIGSSAKKVFDYFNKLVPVEVKKTLEECVIEARKFAVENYIVLLSPACASFDMFDNFEHRGKVFKEAVNNLK
ncbi:MAG: UDP-N-acetylmuramoyl-L-alanine--D-glutamate ligase [Ignavibacteriales bacterium]|nr:UDP-N-acetylmuramoyl-L-alanine--D-glutamate ligase [Ignavibacteriales bacterium]